MIEKGDRRVYMLLKNTYPWVCLLSGGIAAARAVWGGDNKNMLKKAFPGLPNETVIELDVVYHSI